MVSIVIGLGDLDSVSVVRVRTAEASRLHAQVELDPGSGPGLRGDRGSGQRTPDSGKKCHAHTLVRSPSSEF